MKVITAYTLISYTYLPLYYVLDFNILIFNVHCKFVRKQYLCNKLYEYKYNIYMIDIILGT